jgi:acyl CoA:acetate/3-ketoacid CoA transferase alpha subunit
MEVLSLGDAVARHVRPGDRVHIVLGHTRWTAAAREVARQHWGTDPGFELQMLSLGSLAALWFRGGLVRRVVTTYSGDPFPTYTPNPIFQEAYTSGAVEVEHWSILTFQQRMEAAARGLPAIVTGSIRGSSMATNAAFTEIDDPFGGPDPVGLMAPLVPDVALLHAPVADRFGNVAVAGPMMEGLWGAWAARRGAVVTVERLVDDLSPWGNLVQLPGHRVLALVECPFGGHPGGVFARGLPADSYGEDIAFWSECRAASRRDFDTWAKTWCLDVADQQTYLDQLGAERLEWLRGRADPDSWKADEAAHPVDTSAPASEWETAAVLGARHVASRVRDEGFDAVLAGAGVANLAAWVAVTGLRDQGRPVRLTAELGLWGYTPTAADPYIFNHRVFPGAEMLADASRVLGLVMSGPGTRSLACIGAAQIDRHGNVNSTTLVPDGGPFLVGSGGANDVASRADECVVVTLARPARIVERCAYVTSPGRNVRAVCTNLGVLGRDGDGDLRVVAVPAGAGPLDDRVRAFRGACGYAPDVVRNVAELPAVTRDEVVALRRYDPEGLFLS